MLRTRAARVDQEHLQHVAVESERALVVADQRERVLAEGREHRRDRARVRCGEEAPAGGRRQRAAQLRHARGRVVRGVEAHRRESNARRERGIRRDGAVEPLQHGERGRAAVAPSPQRE